MKLKFTSLIILLLCATSGFSQQIREGFEGLTFPPTGWSAIDVQGASVWEQSNVAANSGLQSAYIQYDGTAGEDWLIMPTHHGLATDSLIFWVQLEYAGYAPDSLVVRVSTTGTNIATDFTDRILKLEEGVNYPGDNTTWVRYAVPMIDYADLDIYVAFVHYDENGDGLFLDDVSLGTPPPDDVTATSIDVNANIVASVPFAPKATFSNVGSATQTFSVTLSASGYTSTKTVTNLPPSSAQQVTFDNWSPAPGAYTLTATATLAGDADLSNNTITSPTFASPGFTNYGWVTSDILINPKVAQGTAAYRAGPAAHDTTFLVLISGGDDTFTPSTIVNRQNTFTGAWSTLAPVPTARLQAQAYQYNGKIYYIGGYTTASTPTSLVSVYDINTNVWSAGPSMPTAVGDYAGCQFQDSLIYIISGYNGTTEVGLVQIFNAKSNTWSAGTAFSGTLVQGARAGVANNKIVIAGGYNGGLGATVAQAYVGTINPANYHTITWTAIANYPAGAVARLAASGLSGSDLVYFTGGDPDGSGTLVTDDLWAYDVVNNAWKLGPNKITAASNLENFTEIKYNDSLYLAATGGYNGFGVLDVNEWIKLAKAPIVIPLTLIDFTAALRNGQAILNWNVSEDGMGGYYMLQKSKDAISFTDLKKVFAGREVRTVGYQAPDALPYRGYTYYRLKIVNIDGSISYSPVRSVLTNAATAVNVAVSMYPNPSRGMVKLDIQSNSTQSAEYHVRITDITGKVVESNNFTMDNLLSLNFNLQPGAYVIEVNSRDNNFKWNQKLIVF